MPLSHVNGHHMGELVAKKIEGNLMRDRVPFIITKSKKVNWLPPGSSHSTGVGKVKYKDIEHMGAVIKRGETVFFCTPESVRYGSSFKKVPKETMDEIRKHIRSEIDRIHGKGAHKKFKIY